MRVTSWLYAVSVLLFVSGIGLVITSARVSPRRSSSLATPIASMKEIMNGMVTPASDAVFAAVSVIVTKEGTEEKEPKTDAEWQTLVGQAATLVEVGNLLLVD